ncbi:type II toxin-antitoxin system PemK/MazF family toxin [Bacillus cereus]|nr:type II toxin-antitoxin system PemK/MazF family toxin [Bacillus cereus]
MSVVKRGDVYFADLSPVVGSEQGGVRPVLVITNDIANRFSPSINIAAITSQIQKAKLPTHVEINSKHYGFEKDSVILLEQTRTIDKTRLKEKVTHLDKEVMNQVDKALLVQLGIVEF